MAEDNEKQSRECVLGSGILQPLMQYRFRAFLITSNGVHENITREIEYFNYDLVKRECKCKIRLPVIGNQIQQSLFNFCHDPQSHALLESLEGTGETAHSVKFKNLKITKCELINSYAKDDMSHFIVEFNFDNIVSTTMSVGEEVVVKK